MTDVSEFDYPYDIEKISTTYGSYDSSGNWSDDEENNTGTIEGNFSPQPLIDWARRETDAYEEGEARLFTDTSLDVGDKVRVHLDNSGSNFHDYRVDGVIDNYGFIDSKSQSIPSIASVNKRTEYKLIRLGD